MVLSAEKEGMYGSAALSVIVKFCLMVSSAEKEGMEVSRGFLKNTETFNVLKHRKARNGLQLSITKNFAPAHNIRELIKA